MAAPGQRIHPAGSRHPDPRYAATPPSEALDATREHVLEAIEGASQVRPRLGCALP